MRQLGEEKIDLAKVEMPGMRYLIEKYRKEKPLKGARVSGCMSFTAETAVLIYTLIELGAKVRWCSSNPKALDKDIIKNLKGNNIEVFSIDQYPFEECKDMCLFNNGVFWPNLLIDDGSGLVKLIDEKYPEESKNLIGATEETTSGVHDDEKIEKIGRLNFPIIAVNDSITKSKFDNIYGCGESFIDGIKQSINILLAGKKVVVIGYGQVGKGIAKILKGYGSNVTIVEVDPICALQGFMDGFQVKKISEVSSTGELFVTTTGNINVIPKEEVLKMKNGSILCNMGHDNSEIEMPEYIKKILVKDNIEKNFFQNNKWIYLLGEGYVVNLACASGHSSFAMSCSFTNQVIASIYLWKNKLPNKVLNLPRTIDELVAKIHLEACGIFIDDLTNEQRKYLGIEKGDSLKKNTYPY